MHTHTHPRDVQDCQQRLSSTFDLLLIFLCSLIQTLTLTPPPNNALLAILDMYDNFWYCVIPGPAQLSVTYSTEKQFFICACEKSLGTRLT